MIAAALRLALALLVLQLAAANPLGANQSAAAADEPDLDLAQVQWWRKTNLYHIYIRSFYDSDADGYGDLRGIVLKLDYLQSIGVETLLLSPFYSSPMADIGYDIDNHTEVAKQFGTMEDFDDLVRELRRRHMRLVVDFVPNHTSNKHKWFKCSERALLEPERCGKYKDYYIWNTADRFHGYPNNWISVFGGGPAWTWSPLRKAFYLHQFLPQQPDVNLTNPDVRAEYAEIARFWLRKGADGIRVDALMFLVENTHDWRDEQPDPAYVEGRDDPYTRLLHSETFGLQASIDIVADWRAVVEEPEFGGRPVIIIEAYAGVDRLLALYGRGPDQPLADMPFAFDLLQLNSSRFSPQSVQRSLEDWLRSTRSLHWPDRPAGAPTPWSCWVSGNHDNTRVLDRMGFQFGETFRWLSYLAPGVPTNYYGDEIGLANSERARVPKRTLDEGEPSRLLFRAPMQWTPEEPSAGFSVLADTWLPIHADYKTNNVQRMLNSSERNLLTNFVRLQKLRDARQPLFITGDLVFFPTSKAAAENQAGAPPVLALARTSAKHGNLLMLANLDANRAHPVHLQPVASSSLRARPAQPPQRGRVLLSNLVHQQDQPTLEGLDVDLDGLVLQPARAIIISYQ